MRGRPEIPPSYVVNLDAVVNLVYITACKHPEGVPWSYFDVDVVIPIWESLPEKTAKNLVYILDRKMYVSNKSRFVEYLETTRSNGDKFYIYDKFKANSYSHKKGYKELMIEIPYTDKSEEPIFLPVYWRIN